MLVDMGDNKGVRSSGLAPLNFKLSAVKRFCPVFAAACTIQSTTASAARVSYIIDEKSAIGQFLLCLAMRINHCFQCLKTL